MAMLHCKSCGRVYNYEKNGTCPKCGAYNRPPRREIVEADGSIRYVTTEQKVCYEEKECHEDAVRQETRSYNYNPETPDDDDEENEEDEEIGGQDNAVKKLWQHRNAIATSGGKKSVAAIAIITALISLVTTLVRNLSGNWHGVSVQEPWESVSEEAAAEVHNLIACEGNELYTEYGSVTINSCQVKGDVLHLDLQCDDIENISVSGYYETLTDSGELEMVEAYSSGDLYTYLASLPEDITASDCAAVLDIPFEAGINRYWVWPEHPICELGDEFAFCSQQLFLSKWRQEGNGADIYIDCEHDILLHCEATLTALNVNGQPYTTYLESSQCRINYTDGRNTAILNFTLRSKNDTVQSITLLDNETMRQITVNLQ